MIQSTFALNNVNFTYNVTYEFKGFEPANSMCNITFSKVKNEIDIEFTQATGETQAKLIFLGVEIKDVSCSPENSSTKFLKNEVWSESEEAM